MKRALAVAGAAYAAEKSWKRAHALDLRGRVAVVTGGSRGLGFALCRELRGRGARVATCARGAEQLEEARRKLGDDVVAIPCDVGDREQVETFVASVEERLGPIEILVNNAGVIAVGPLATQTHADFEEMIAVQLWGPINMTLAVLQGMRERSGGRIANVTSIGGKISVPWLLPYNTAKFGAVGFSEGLRAELAGTGIKVTTVVPGLMRTGSFLAAYFKGDRAALEYSLFTPLSSTPATTVRAERAARRIVDAIRFGDPEITLGLHAKLAARANGVAPGAVSTVLELVARALPEVQGTQRRRGSDIESPVDDSFLTALGRRAARNLNQ
ncbi:MAG TPA: SDR family NAD(P)-dependent oxidoreductase [Gaiellaceae bacterium]|nr:SDR family NAD(P)-dependent oxidoreductase [Gaiellaceae bacterium]